MTKDEVSVFVLLDGTQLISIFKRISSQLGEPDVLLKNPYKVCDNPSFYLEPWLGNLTKDDEIVIHSDKVLTSVDPNDKIFNLYERVLSGDDTKSLPKINLNESV